MSKKSYSGEPEHYMIVPKKQEIDTDALNCILTRARGVCILLSGQFNDDSDRFSDHILDGAVWALNGLIDQAEIIVNGKEE